MTQANYLLKTQSQYHRIVEVGKNLLKPSSPTTLLRQSQPEKVAQVCVHSGFEYFYGQRFS